MPHSNQPKTVSGMEQINEWIAIALCCCCFSFIEIHVTIFLYTHTFICGLPFFQPKIDITFKIYLSVFLYGGAYNNIAQLKDFYISFWDIRRAYNSHTLNENVFMCNFWRLSVVMNSNSFTQEKWSFISFMAKVMNSIFLFFSYLFDRMVFFSRYAFSTSQYILCITIYGTKEEIKIVPINGNAN